MFDKDVFISEKIANKNSEIMDSYFTLNKKLDNLMDFVDIKYVMPKFSEGLHKIAHKAPIDADDFRDYNALYSYRTMYREIGGQYRDFSNPLEGIEHILEHIGDMDNLFAEGKAIATAEQNYDYHKFLDAQIEKLRAYKKQFVLLYDKLKEYMVEGNSFQDFDSRCEAYFTMG